MQPAGAQRRDALYYPYIHIRGDIAWLKATLLCFPHVKRMVPRDFEINDPAEVRPYTTTKGARGQALLGRVDLDAPEVAQAQTNLGRRLAEEYERDQDGFLERLSRRAALESQGNDSTFQIHREKFLDVPTWLDPQQTSLLGFLRAHDLVWQPEAPNLGPGEWWALHPDLGEAVMATVACTIASGGGLDIVTDDGTMHDALARADPDSVFDSVLAGRATRQPPGLVETTDEIVHLVVLNYFDVESLSVADIASMSRDEDGLFAFKDAVARIASELPGTTNVDARSQDLQWVAERVLSDWEESRKSMSQAVRAFFSPDIVDVSQTFLSSGLGAALGLALVGPDAAMITAAPGLFVGLIGHGAKVLVGQRKRDAQNPYRYLSKVVDMGAAYRKGTALVIARPPGAGA